MVTRDKTELLQQIRQYIDATLCENSGEQIYYKASLPGWPCDAQPRDSALLHRILTLAPDDLWASICALFGEQSAERRMLEDKRDALKNRTGRAFVSSFESDEVIDMIGEALDASLSDMTFYETLVLFVVDSGYPKVSDFYNRMGIDHRYWHRYKKGFIPTKKRLVEMIFYLRLGSEDAEYLMNVAGYTFQRNNVTDVIVQFFLKNGYADEMEPEQLLMLLDEVLINFGQPPIHSEE